MMKDTAALADLLPAHALGALDGEDLTVVDAALRVDRELQSAAAAWQREVEQLALAAEPLQVSETTRARVLQRIAQDSAVRTKAVSVVAPARPVAPDPGNRWLLRAVAAVLAVAVAWGLSDRSNMRGEVNRLQDNLAQVSAQLAKASNEIVTLKAQSHIVASPDMHPVVLAGLEAAPASVARTFISPHDGKALFYAYSLPAPPTGKQYQLWFIADGKPVSAGVFDVDREGNGSLLVDHVAPLASIQAWAVTIEPMGGLAAPSGAMVLKG
ncbi:MAG: anti-sigma factor [Acidobacteriota bacterium]